jgi:PPOX class probable F420-dependent enzyme
VDPSDALNSELVREILESRLIANLATANLDGSIHIVPMWFVWDGDAVLIPTHEGTRKARNLQRDPRATVMIDDSKGGFDLRGVTLVCDAEIEQAPTSLELNRRIHLKYLTEHALELEAVGGYLTTDDVTLRLQPVKVSSWDLRNTDQGRAVLESRAFHPLVAVH